MLAAFVKAFETADRFNRESALREENKKRRAALAEADAKSRKDSKEARLAKEASGGKAEGGADFRLGLNDDMKAALALKKGGAKNLVDSAESALRGGRVKRHGG